MKKYRVNVNGTVYEVEIEEMSRVSSSAASSEVTPSQAPKAAPAASAKGEVITAPMPGNILSVNVNAGDKVTRGQVLMILEAMKMENEIMSPVDGIVASVSVTKGTAVDTGTELITIE